LGDFPSVSHNVTFTPVSAVERRSKGYKHFHLGGPNFFTHDNKVKASDARRGLLASPRIRGAGRRSVGSGEERRTILLPWDCENTPWRRSSRTLATSRPGQNTVEERRRRRDAVSAAGMLWRGSVVECAVESLSYALTKAAAPGRAGDRPACVRELWQVRARLSPVACSWFTRKISGRHAPNEPRGGD